MLVQPYFWNEEKFNDLELAAIIKLRKLMGFESDDCELILDEALDRAVNDPCLLGKVDLDVKKANNFYKRTTKKDHKKLIQALRKEIIFSEADNHEEEQYISRR